jgi:hypothetical protein
MIYYLALAIILFLVLVLSGPALRLFKKSGITNKNSISEYSSNVARKEAIQLRNDADDRYVRKLGSVYMMPTALTILKMLNHWQFLKTFWKTPMIYEFGETNADVLVVFAIYEKNNLRPDIKNALIELKKLGCSILLVNSRKLSIKSRNELSDLITIYMERANYGRDFGSYKDGIIWLYKNKKHEMLAAKKLLVLNDSVFYSRNRLGEFFSDLIASESAAIGATLNYERSPHIGSFCLSFNANIFLHKKFIKYWSKYRKTDLRAHTIKYGELALSKMLTRISPDDPAINALYEGHNVVRLLQDNEALLKSIHNANRNAERDMNTLRSNIRVEMIRMDYHLQHHGSESIFQTENVEDRLSFAGTFDDGFEAFKRGATGDLTELYGIYKKSLISFIGNEFDKRSQIHQNATILPLLGCPIIKLDLEFRGVTDSFDRMTICESLHPDDASALSRLLASRPWGETSLSGWRLAAFQWGHL